MISCSQIAYVKNRFVSESRKLISNNLELSNPLNTKKAFDSVYHSSLILVFKTFGFGKLLLQWIQIL